MCHHCCIEQVKERMLSRRDVFRGMAVAGAAAALGGTLGEPAEARSLTLTEAGVNDMTHELHPAFPTYFGQPGFAMTQKFNYAEHKFNLFEWTVNEHTGTHMDAPLHFSADGKSISEVPVEDLVCPLAVIDIRERADADADAQVTPDDIAAWKSANGDLPQGGCIALLSGWDRHVATDKFRNADGEGKMHFPGFHIEAAKMLIEDGNIIGMAVDTLSLDHGPSADFAVHYAWLPTGRWGLENIANLEAMPAAGATLVVGAPKVKGGSGGPCRVMAFA